VGREVSLGRTQHKKSQLASLFTLQIPSLTDPQFLIYRTPTLNITNRNIRYIHVTSFLKFPCRAFDIFIKQSDVATRWKPSMHQYANRYSTQPRSWGPTESIPTVKSAEFRCVDRLSFDPNVVFRCDPTLTAWMHSGFFLRLHPPPPPEGGGGGWVGPRPRWVRPKWRSGVLFLGNFFDPYFFRSQKEAWMHSRGIRIQCERLCGKVFFESCKIQGGTGSTFRATHFIDYFQFIDMMTSDPQPLCDRFIVD